MELSLIVTYGLLLLSVFTLLVQLKLISKVPTWLMAFTLCLISAAYYNYLEVYSVLYLGVYGLCVYKVYQTERRLVFFVLVVLLSIPLLFHVPILGFHNYKYFDHVQVSENAYPFSMYFNLDKSAVGLCILGFSPQQKSLNFFKTLKIIILYLAVMLVLFFGITTSLSFVQFDLKWPTYTIIWMLNNLFIVCLVEEAFFRKFIQDKLFDFFPLKKYAWLPILISAIFFGAVHFQGGWVYVILAIIAGGFYGHIYYFTKKMESAILLHFLFNLVHFIFFTYPAIKA